MKQLLILLKKDFLIDYSFIINRNLMSSNRNMKNFIGYVLLGIFAIFPIRMIISLFDNPAIFALKDIFLVQLIASSQLVIIFLFLGTIVSKIYFSDDVNILIGLPIKPTNILLSKILNITLNAFLFSGLFAIPAGIKYGIVSSNGILFYLFLILGTFMVTAITISLLTLIIVWSMKFINKLPNVKNIIQTFGMIIILIFSIGLQIFIRTINLSTENVAEIISNSKKITDAFLVAMPYLRPFVNSLTSVSILQSLFWFLLLVITTVGILYFVSTFSFNTMMSGISDNVVVHSKKKSKNQNLKVLSPKFAIASKDVKEIIGTPVYVYNILSMGLLLPVLMILPAITNSQISLSDLLNGKKLLEMLNLTSTNLILLWLALGLGISMLLSTGGSTSLSSLSREGKSMWLLKILPVRYKDIVDGKTISSAFFQFLSILPFTIILIIIFRPGIIELLSYILSVSSTVFLVSNFGMYLGVGNVKLDWDNPQQIIKNTFPTIINMLFCIAYLAVVVYSIFNLTKTNVITADTAIFVLLGCIILNFVIGFLIRKKNISKLAEMMITYGE